MSWADAPFMVLDFETTSKIPCSDFTRPVQIGFFIAQGMENMGGGITVYARSPSLQTEVNMIVDPGIESSPGALKIHEKADEDVRKKGKPIKEAFESLVKTITKHRDHPIMIYNAPFDYTILIRECKRHGLVLPSLNVLDPMVWAREFYPDMPHHRLGDMAKMFGIDQEKAHDALADVKTTIEVAQHIIKKNQQLRDLSIKQLQVQQKRWAENWEDRMESKITRSWFHFEKTEWPAKTCDEQSWSLDQLDQLNEKQFQAVTNIDGPLLINAGPGSGKTRVIADRAAYLIGERRVPPWKILAVTFTNKAARELQQRCKQVIGASSGDIAVSTLHKFCAGLLRDDGIHVDVKPKFQVLDDEDQARAIRRILKGIGIEPEDYPPRSVLGVISDAKNNLQSPEHFSKRVENYEDEVISRVYEVYQSELLRTNTVDFDDLLLKTYQLLEGYPEVLKKYQKQFQYLMVDEFQDTNALQFKVVRLLALESRNICVVGDPDQSIYSWRQADPSNLTDFQSTFNDTKIITVDQNYRSTQTILEAADSVIGNNDGRMEKNLWTENDRGSKITVAEAYNEWEEARLVLQAAAELQEKYKISRNEIAVIYRSNAQSRVFEAACTRQRIPYRLVGGVKFYARKEVKDILAFLRLLANPADDVALERVINVPRRGISLKSLDELRRVALANNVPILDVILDISRVKGGDEEPAAYVCTLATRALNSIARFGDLITRLFEQSLALETSLALDTIELIDLVVELTGYRAMLREDKERGEEQMENLQELKASVVEFFGSEENVQLTDFLENAVLDSDGDKVQGGDGSGADAITLITLHQAKGLEYDAVFLVGLEEGILPHARSIIVEGADGVRKEDPAQLEEERRLLYVGMTRARKRLYMFRAFQRSFRDQSSAQGASRFLLEIPESLVTTRGFRDHLRVADRIPDPMWTKRAASTPAPRPATRSSEEFAPGDKVKHDVFGKGVVVSSSGSGSDTQVTVAFVGEGVKRLMLSFAPIERIVDASPDSNEDEPIIQDPDFFAP